EDLAAAVPRLSPVPPAVDLPDLPAPLAAVHDALAVGRQGQRQPHRRADVLVERQLLAGLAAPQAQPGLAGQAPDRPVAGERHPAADRADVQLARVAGRQLDPAVEARVDQLVVAGVRHPADLEAGVYHIAGLLGRRLRRLLPLGRPVVARAAAPTH